LFWHITQRSSKKRARAIKGRCELYALGSTNPNACCATSSIEVIFHPSQPIEITRRRRIERTRVSLDPLVRRRHGLIDYIKSSIHPTFHERRDGRSNSPVLISRLISAGRGRDAGPAQVSFTVKMHRFRVESLLLRHVAGLLGPHKVVDKTLQVT
jgi:hypothetical protein